MVRAVQMDNLKGLLDIRRMDSALNVQIRQLCGATKRMDEGKFTEQYGWMGSEKESALKQID